MPHPPPLPLSPSPPFSSRAVVNDAVLVPDATEGIEDEQVAKMRTQLLPDYALHIEKDVQKAITKLDQHLTLTNLSANKEGHLESLTILAPDDFSPDPITDAEGAAMFRAVVNLFGLWGTTDLEAATMLDLPVRTYARWKAGGPGRIGRDGKARLSNLMGIYKALRIIFRCDSVHSFFCVKSRMLRYSHQGGRY